MKMKGGKKKYLVWFWSIAVSLFCCVMLTSCKHEFENDLQDQPPKVDSTITIGEHHAQTLHGYAGIQSKFEIYFSDDIGLKDMTCAISTPEEGLHSHINPQGESVPAFQQPTFGEWEDEASMEIGGTHFLCSVKFDTPIEASGRFQFEVTATDNAGNECKDHNTLMIENDSLPSIIPDDIFPTPHEDGGIHMDIGEAVVVEGHIIDNDGLSFVTAEILDSSQVIWQVHYHDLESNAFNLALIEFPAMTEPGEFSLKISAGDVHNWNTFQQAVLEVE